MENQDKLFDQIKSAEANAEGREFPGLDSVWSRVEDKLDNKVLAKQNRKWKQWAVAASVIAVVSIGLQFLQTEERPDSEREKINVVTKDAAQPVSEPGNAVADAVADTTVIRKDAPRILEEAINPASVADTDTEAKAPVPAPVTSAADDEIPVPAAEAITGKAGETQSFFEEQASRERVAFSKGHVFKARSVRREDSGFLDEMPKQKQAAPEAKKAAPLFVVDGKPITAKSESDYKKKLDKAVSEIREGASDTIIYLTEPLYIINGVEYSEESLFGPNPTSPYAPLNLQEEGMTTLIVTGDEAVKQYGRKGRNGVVIITTKNGKPAPLEAQPNRAQQKK